VSKKAGSARAALQAQRAKQAEAERRKERLMRVGIAVGVVVVLVAIAALVQWQRSQVDTTAAFPAGASALGGGVAVGKASAPVLVEAFEDFACPHCKEFEDSAEAALNSYVSSGQVRVVYYPVTLPGFGRPTELAANAFGCAADSGKGQAYHDALYANYRQDWTNAQLVELGKTVGLTSGKFNTCVNSDSFNDWVKSIDQTSSTRGVQGTPTIFVNGKQIPEGDTSLDGLRVAVDNALESKS
jgi:protein-disulfide isomerase